MEHARGAGTGYIGGAWDGCTAGGYQGGYTGVVPGRAIPGYYPATLLEEQRVQRSGPRRPCRGRSGWYPAADVPAAGDGSRTTLRARSVWPASLPCPGP